MARGSNPRIAHLTLKALDFFNPKSGRTTWLLYACLVALLAFSMVQAIHVCNSSTVSGGLDSQGGDASPISTACPICLAIQSATFVLICLVLFLSSLRREFVVAFQSFRFVEVVTPFQLSVRPPPAGY